MSYHAQTAKLILRCNDIPTSAQGVTSVGYSSNNKSNCTWTNISLRELLGNEFYDSYEQFNLVFTDIGGSGSTTLGNSGDDRAINIYLGGLNFLNQTYNTATKTSDHNKAYMGSFIFTANSGFGWKTGFSANVSTFRKSDLVNISLMLLRGVDNQPPASGADWNCTLCFNIYGVDSSRSRNKGHLIL